MYSFCHSVAAAVGLPHFLILLDWLSDIPLLSFPNPLFLFQFFLSLFISSISLYVLWFLFVFSVFPFSVCLPLSSVSISFHLLSLLVRLSLRVRLYLPAWLHLCPPSPFTLSNPLMSLQHWQPPRGGWWDVGGALLLSQSHPDTWVKPGRTTLKITWWIDSPLRPSFTLRSLYCVHSLLACGFSSAALLHSVADVGRAASYVANGSWRRKA